MDYIRRHCVTCLEALLYTDGVLCVLSAPMAHQVGAVDPVDELSLSLEPLHWSCKPAAQKSYDLEPPDVHYGTTHEVIDHQCVVLCDLFICIHFHHLLCPV